MTASTRKKTKEIAEEEAKNKETLGDDDKKRYNRQKKIQILQKINQQNQQSFPKKIKF